jgi:hypothetical protein
MSKEIKSVEVSELWLGSFVTLLGEMHQMGYTGIASKEILDWIETQDMDSLLERINNIIDDISPSRD